MSVCMCVSCRVYTHMYVPRCGVCLHMCVLLCTLCNVCAHGACVWYVSNSELWLGPLAAPWPNPAHSSCYLLVVVSPFPAMEKDSPRLFEKIHD